MTDDDEELCPQCGFAFVEGEMVSQLQGYCPDHGWEVVLIVHTVVCWPDHLASLPKEYSRNKQIAMRRLN